MGSLITAKGDGLDGLRSFLDDWNTGIGPDRERDEHTRKALQEITQAQIYSSYLKQAEHEDKLLVQGWTETSNILLVFSGLQSAIVVAFIIFAETSGNDLGQTNALLQSILYRLDNSTTIPMDDQSWQAAPSVGSYSSSCWYASLACSSLSAFGGLLHKHGVIYYASRPAWANTTILQCRLRELRHEGYRKWKMAWQVDALIILLLLSVLFFVIGLVAHCYNTSLPHFAVALSFTVAAAANYFPGAVAGTFIPGCPFKSPITVYIHEVLTTSAFFLLRVALWILTWSREILSIICGAGRLSSWMGVQTLRLEASGSRVGRSIVVGDVEKEAVENGTAGAAGILGWWLFLEDSEYTSVDTRTVVNELTSFSAQDVITQIFQAHSFALWSSKVVGNLQSLPSPSSPSRTYHLQMGELLCSLMHQDLAACKLALKATKAGIPNREKEFCSILREAWCSGRSSDVLPIKFMRWSTISLYLQLQLRSLSLLQGHEQPVDRLSLTQDLSAVLQDSRVVKSKDIAGAAALVILIIADGSGGMGGLPLVNQLANQTPTKGLLQALYILSKYPSSNSSNPLILGAVRVTANMISNCLDDDQSFLSQRRYWRDGEIAETLLRLLRFGRSWLCQDVPTQIELGRMLTNEIWRVMSRVVSYFIADRTVLPGLLTLSSDEGLVAILQSYGHPSTSPSVNLDALRVMGFVLGVRSYRPQSISKRFLPWINQKTPSTPPEVAFTSIVTDYPHAITQLIHDIENSGPLSEERGIILSVLIKSRHIFSVSDIISIDRGLQDVLDLVGTQMIQSGHPLMPVEEPYLRDFHHWDEVVAVLRQLERESLRKGAGQLSVIA